MATLKTSEQGKKKIQQARNDKGWNVDDPKWLVEASNILESHRNWQVESPPFASGVSEGTWKAFLYRQRGVETEVFKAYCKVLGLSWEEIREVTNESVVSQGNSDWRQICRKMLESQKPSIRRQATEIVSEPFFVQLGLVERRHQPRRDRDFSISPEQGSGFFHLAQEEIIETYENDEFLEQVIKQGQSKKSQGKRIAIIGEPGAGKTTLLEAIAFSPLTPGFPIWISLGSLGEKSLEEYLCQKWLKDALKTSDVTQQQKALEELFKSGEVLLLLDGVDEMPAPSPVEALAKIREELTGWVAEARVVLTCRVNVWDASINALQGFDTYRTLEFSYGDGNKPDQVREFICQWFSKAEKPALGEPLREKLNEDRHQRIRDLVKNPLRLSLLCQSWYFRQGDLPKTKAALYEQFTEAFYEWKKESFPTGLTERKELNAVLGRLAREAIDKEKSRFGIRRDFALEVMGEELFKLATEKLNWLVEVYKDVDTGKPIYAFFHPTFQEYFAACAIDDWHFFLNHNNENPNPFLKYNNKDCVYRVFEQQWKEVILLWFGRRDEEVPQNKKNELVQTLVNFEDKCQHFYGYKAYCIAEDGIEEFLECSLRERIFTIWKIPLDEIHYVDKGTWEKLHPSLFELKLSLSWIEKLKLDFYYPWNLLEYLGFDLKKFNKADIVELEKNTNALIQMLRTSQSDLTTTTDAIANSEDIKTIIENLTNSPDAFIRRLALKRLLKITSCNPTAFIYTLNNNQYISSYENIHRLLAWLLDQVIVEEPETVNALTQLLQLRRDERLREKAAGKLKTIERRDLLKVVVKNLRERLIDKECLTDEAYKNDCDFQNCYSVILHCAQNMHYRDFYEAWHDKSSIAQA
jgi:predicted NACHT family NTPase